MLVLRNSCTDLYLINISPNSEYSLGHLLASLTGELVIPAGPVWAVLQQLCQTSTQFPHSGCSETEYFHKSPTCNYRPNLVVVSDTPAILCTPAALQHRPIFSCSFSILSFVSNCIQNGNILRECKWSMFAPERIHYFTQTFRDIFLFSLPKKKHSNSVNISVITKLKSRMSFVNCYKFQE